MTDDDRLSEIISFKASTELVAELDAQLDYHDSRSEWLREMCRQQLDDETPTEPASE